MELDFSGTLWFWKGPAPWYFVTIPEAECAAIESTASVVSYGWGVIPVAARVGNTRWTTSLFPKDGAYLLPFKAAVRKAESLALGDTIRVRLVIDV